MTLDFLKRSRGKPDEPSGASAQPRHDTHEADPSDVLSADDGDLAQDIIRLQKHIAQGLFDALPQVGWTSADYRFKGIARFAEDQRVCQREDGTDVTFVVPREVALQFFALREGMARMHENGHAWFTAVLHIRPEGHYKFDFDYDTLPVFEAPPSAQTWAAEFAQYPRPELEKQVPQIPD